MSLEDAADDGVEEEVMPVFDASAMVKRELGMSLGCVGLLLWYVEGDTVEIGIFVGSGIWMSPEVAALLFSLSSSRWSP